MVRAGVGWIDGWRRSGAPQREGRFSGRVPRVCLRYPGRSLLELFERAPSGARSRVVPRLEIIVPGAGYSAPGAFCYVPMGQKEDEQKETKLMKTIQISDVTLRMAEASALSLTLIHI